MKPLHKKMHDLLFLLAYLEKNDGVPVDEAARALGVPRRELLAYVDDVLAFCGRPPFCGGDLVEVAIERDRLYLTCDQQLGRPLRLTQQEVLALSVALGSLGGSDAGPVAAAARAVLDKLRGMLAGEARRAVEALEQQIALGQEDRGIEARFRTLETGLRDGRAVEIEYFSEARGETTRRRLRPHRLLDHLGSWYVVGHDDLRGEERIFKVERIRTATLTDERFEPPRPRPGDPLRRKLLFVPPKDARRARVRFGPRTARGLADRWVRDLERAPDGSATGTVEYADPEWLAGFVLSYGGDVEVLGPDEARAAVAARCRAILAAC